MSERLDLFLEKTLAKMNLDEAQAADVGRELRGHLEEAIADATAKGLAPEQAETEAMLLFGQPSLLVRQFGLLHGKAWLIVERLAAAAPFALLITFNVTHGLSLPHYFTFALVYIFFAVAMLLPLWDTVEINGVLRIRRLFHRTVAIPFADVREISFVKGHLFGKRHLILCYSGGRMKLPNSLRNMRCLAIALGILAPAALNPEVREYFKRAIISVRVEGPLFRGIFSVLWLGVFVLFALAFSPTWNIEGFSVWLIASWVLALAVAYAQAVRHSDRSKKTACWLALAGFLISVTLGGEMLAGNLDYVRPTLIFFGAMILYPPVALWWRGRRARLLLLLTVFVVSALVGGLFAPPVGLKNIETLVVAPMATESSTWLKTPEPVYIAIGTLLNQTKEEHESAPACFLQASRMESKFVPLDSGFMQGLLPNYSDDTATLVSTDRAPHDEYVSRIYLYKPGEKPRLIYTLPRMLINYPRFWSPDRTWFTVPFSVQLTSETSRLDLKIIELKTGREQSFEGRGTSRLWWLDDHTLRVLKSPPREEIYKNRNELLPYEIWRIDARTGSQRLEHTVKIEKGFDPDDCIRQIMYFNDKNGDHWARLDLERGEFKNVSGEVPLLVGQQGDLVAYYLNQEGEQHLIVEDNAGIRLNRPIAQGEKIDQIRISPYGKKLAFLYQNGRRVIGSGLYSWRVLDITTGHEETLEIYNLLSGVVTSLMTLHTHQPAVQWTPEGKSIAYPMFTWGLSEGKLTQSYTAIRLAAIE